MTDSEVDDFLRCDVCKDSFYDPITLLCQHSFCSYCVSTLKECPMCRLKLHLPKQRNLLLTKAIEILYGPEKLEELNSKFHLTKLEKEIRPQVEKDLRNDFDKMLIDNSKTLPKPPNENDYKNISVDTTPSVNPPKAPEEPVSSWWSPDNLVKWVEFAFLAYYLYTFIVSTANYGFSWIKFVLNLFVLFQAAIPFIGSNYLSLSASNPMNGVLENLL